MVVGALLCDCAVLVDVDELAWWGRAIWYGGEWWCGRGVGRWYEGLIGELGG